MSNYFLATRNHFALTAPAADTTSGLAKGDVVGFNCAPDPQTGAPFYKEIDGQTLVNLFYNSQADPTAKNPEEELPIILSDYRSGFGLDIQDYNDPKRSFSSYGCDLRFKDRVGLSYGYTALTYPTNVVYNADMEENRDWTNGSQSAVQAHAGTYSWVQNSGGADVYQDLPWSATYQGCEFTFTAWLWAAGAGGTGARIGIDDGVTITYSTAHAGTSAWVQKSVVKTLGAAATRLRILFDNDCGSNAYIDDVTIAGTTVGTLMSDRSPKIGVDFNGHHYIAIGRNLCKINGTTGAFTHVTDATTTITDLETMTISGTDYLFIAQGVASPYYYITTAEARTTSNAAAPNYQYFEVVYTTATTMYGNDTNSTIRSTTNPLNGGVAWSDQTQVDNDAWDILDLDSKSGALYIRKEDKPYYLSAAGAVQNDLAPEVEILAADTQDRTWDIWNNEIFYGCGAQSLIRIGTSNEWLSPGLYCTNLSSFVGRIFAITHDDQFLWIIVDNGTKIEVMCGRDETVDGSTSWVWHPYQEITLTGCVNAWTSSTYQKRLYIASSTAAESFYYIPLPTGYGNIASDSNRSFLTGGYFETPFLHGRFKSDTKAWIKVIATLGHAYDADIYWTIQYKKLEDSSYTNIGNLVGTATNRTHTLYLPVDGSSNNPVSTMMRFKLIGVTDTTATSPVLLGLDFRSVLYAAKKDIIWAKVRVAKEMITMGGKTIDLYAKMKACLDVCRDGTYPVTMKDIDGSTIQVRFLQLPQNLPWREPVTDEKGKDREFVYNLLMLRTPTTA